MNDSEIKSVCFNERCFNVMIADDSAERTKGLGGFEKLGVDEGMLFVFDEEGKHVFWMKDMNFALDLIWIDSDMKVVYIKKNVQVCDVESCPVINANKESKYVFEINAGLTEEYGIKIGDYAGFTRKV